MGQKTHRAADQQGRTQVQARPLFSSEKLGKPLNTSEPLLYSRVGRGLGSVNTRAPRDPSMTRISLSKVPCLGPWAAPRLRGKGGRGAASTVRSATMKDNYLKGLCQPNKAIAHPCVSGWDSRLAGGREDSGWNFIDSGIPDTATTCLPWVGSIPPGIPCQQGVLGVQPPADRSGEQACPSSLAASISSVLFMFCPLEYFS